MRYLFSYEIKYFTLMRINFVVKMCVWKTGRDNYFKRATYRIVLSDHWYGFADYINNNSIYVGWTEYIRTTYTRLFVVQNFNDENCVGVVADVTMK